MNISIIGAGYVGMSIAASLAQNYNVRIVDIDKKKVNRINQGLSSIGDKEIDNFLKESSINLHATHSLNKCICDAEVIFLALPTNIDNKTNIFNTTELDLTIKKILNFNSHALIVIKSTVPVGYTKTLKNRLGTKNIIYSPEFIREGRSLHDSLYPSRIIIGDITEKGNFLLELIKNSIKKNNPKSLLTSSCEAESIKLFSNAYLAMRVAFFNELDSFAISKDLETKNIIEGVCMDERIGELYRNPSFGFGGYCLPKDVIQLNSDFRDIPHTLINKIHKSNIDRKIFLSSQILKNDPHIIGAHRLVMKAGSNNFRNSAIIDILINLKEKGKEVLIYEPLLNEDVFLGMKVVNDIEKFKDICDIVLVNRKDKILHDIEEKCFTRDIFNIN